MRSFVFFDAVYWRASMRGSVVAFQPPDIGLPTTAGAARRDEQRAGITILLPRVLAGSPLERETWGRLEVIAKSMLRGRDGSGGRNVYWFVVLNFSRLRLHIKLLLAVEESG